MIFDYKKITIDITKIGKEKNPNKMASYIYFLTKQYPAGPFATDYDNNVGRSMRLVKECFSWNKAEIAELQEQLRIYHQYIKK